jgi:hypothetical protein
MAIAKRLAMSLVAAAAILLPTHGHADPRRGEMFDVQYMCSITFTFRSGRDGLRGGEYDGDVYALIRVRGTWHPLVLDRTGVNRGEHWAGWSTHTRTITFPGDGCNALDGSIDAIRLHTRFAGGVWGNNWDLQALRIEWAGHMTSKRGGGTRSISGAFYDRASLLVTRPVCRFSGRRHDFDIAISP